MPADIVIKKSAEKVVGIQQPHTKSIAVNPSSGGGGGTVVTGTPFASAKDNVLTLYMYTLKQLERLHVVTSAGIVTFTITFDGDEYYLSYSESSPAPIAGQVLSEEDRSMYDDDYIFKQRYFEFPAGWTILSVWFDNTDNLLDEGDAWRLAEIQSKIGQSGGEDPNSKALAEFFGVTLLQGYEFMTDTEVTDELEDIMQALDPELEQEVEYPEGSGTYITKAQAITAQAMQIINPSES